MRILIQFTIIIATFGFTNACNFNSSSLQGESALLNTFHSDSNINDNEIGETPESADDFVSSIGVNTHFNYSTYLSNSHSSDLFTDVIQPRLAELRIRRIRDSWTDMGLQFKPFINKINLLKSSEPHLRFLFVTYRDWSSDQPSDACSINKLQVVKQGGTINCGSFKNQSVNSAINFDLEMPNEVDHCASFDTACQTGGGTWYDKSLRHIPDWPSMILNFTQGWFNQIQNQSSLSDIKIIAPSFVHIDDFKNQTFQGQNLETYLSPIIAASQVGNAHGYCFSQASFFCLGSMMDAWLAFFKKPLWLTEIGYYTYADGSGGVTEQSQAKYGIRHLFNQWNVGTRATFFYELLDEEGAATPKESAFGMIRTDGTVKPLFSAVKNVISILADPGSSFQKHKLDYSLSGQTSTIQKTLLQKRDGSNYLILWNEKRTLSDSSEVKSVNLHIATGFSRLEIYSPRLSDQIQYSITGSTDATLLVPDEITIIKILK